jgi:hypothetical protein
LGPRMTHPPGLQYPRRYQGASRFQCCQSVSAVLCHRPTCALASQTNNPGDSYDSVNHVTISISKGPETHTANSVPRNQPPRPGTTYPESTSLPPRTPPTRERLLLQAHSFQRASDPALSTTDPLEARRKPDPTLNTDAPKIATTTSITPPSAHRAPWAA